MRARRLGPQILHFAACMIALVLSPPSWAATSSAADGLPEPLCWRQQAFTIPFKVAAAESPDQQPAEIRLYVSVNSGATWEQAQAVSPQERSFTFRAPHDGEYWFQIRTADRQGHVSPEVGGRPELRVIVDTLPPRLDLTALRGEAGEVKASWQAVDPLLNADSLKIEYQTAAGSWRQVAVDRPSPGIDRSTSTGTLTWFPTDAPAGSVSVRATISDRAGNETLSQALAEPPGASLKHELTASNKAMRPPDADQNWMSTPNAGWSAGGPPANQQLNAALPVRNSASAPSNSGPTTYNAPRSPSANQFAMGSSGNTAWPADRSSDLPLGRNPIPADDLTARPQSASSAPSYAANSPPADYQSPYTGNPSRYGDIASRAVENVNPPIRNQVLPDNNSYRNDVNSYRNDMPPTAAYSNNPQSASPSLSIPSSPTSTGPTDINSSTKGLLPPGERPRMVNARSFDLDYEVDGIGPSGIAKVELWGTRDGGRTWNSYGVDDDNRSPIRANVEGEGLYGFRIVVQSGSGLGGLPPRSGDAPDLWVMVDLTKPAVRLLDATAGEGPHSGELLIRWEASDAALAARPVTLLFSDRPGGQWSIIAAGLENTGQYAWRPDSRVPDRIYLRIEARDGAGNTGVFEAAQPVTLDRIRPEGRIRGVRPSADTATRPSFGDFSR
ncbi:MAG TPA: hypothetical protein VMJ32_18220 [Pirellulales bacterium]|nr:hypothetical protein [Pirellulales bacterium]